ncbi:MAG: hypothetical protein NZ891_00380 [bacterium]|nr:hypothetical protein [bacterium]MDW8163188.1 hypothetical protein [Candidatus Omnitrophota bacterium]
MNRRLFPPTKDIGHYNQTLPPSTSPWDFDWTDDPSTPSPTPDPYNNEWYASYAFVFGLTTNNKSTRPVPVISDRGVYNTEINSDTINYITGNHPYGINVLYIDGSVKWINLQHIDVSRDADDGSPHMGNVAARPNGYSIVINNDVEKTEWGED